MKWLQHCNYSKFTVEEVCHKYMRVPRYNQSSTQSYFFLLSFFVLTVNLIILLNMRKDIIIFIFQCNWNTCNVIYSPVVSVVSSKCAISSGNSTPKLRTKPVLIAPQTAEEIHTTHDQRLSGWCLPRKNQHSFPSISLACFWTYIHVCGLLFLASIKPGTWNIPEHSGTWKNRNYFHEKKKYIYTYINNNNK